MDNIINQFEVPQEDKPMASVYMKMFGNEIGFMDYDAIVERFNQWKQNANIMQVLGKLATEQTIDVSRSNKMMKISSCIPTIAGLPLSLSVDGNTVTQVTASGRMNVMGLMMAPRNLHIEGSIRPSVAVELSTTLKVCAFHTQTGLNHIARLHSDSILDGALIIENGNAMRVKFNVPEEKQTIVDVSSKIFRLHQQDKTEIVGDQQRQFTQEVCTAEQTAKYLGVRICSEITFPTVFTMPGSPSMLLSGPSEVKMTLSKVDPQLTSFELDVAKMTNKEMVNGEVVLTDVFRMMVGTPNTDVKRTYSFIYNLNRNTNQMTIDIESPFKTARIEANVIGLEMHKKLDLTFTINPSATDEKAFRLVAEQEIEMPSEDIIRYIPRFEFTGPKGNNMQVTGSVINNDALRRTDVDLQVLENSATVISVNGPITRTEGSKKSNYGIEMTVGGRYIEGKLTGQVNRNKELYTIDVDMQKKVNGQLVQDPWATVSFIFGSNRDDHIFRLENEAEFTDYPNWNYHFEIESVGEDLINHENTVKLCYRGISCGSDTKVVIVQNNTMTVSNDGTTNQALTFRYNHPAQSKEYEMVQKFKKTNDGSFNVSCLIVDDQVHKNLFNSEIKLRRGGPMSSFSFELATEKRFLSIHNDMHMHRSGRIDFVSTLRRDLLINQKTTTVTFAYAPGMNMHDVDLDIVLSDQSEINIGSRLENNLDQGMLDFDFTIDKYGVQNWVAINIDYRDNSDDTKWEHRASVDVHTPLASLQNKRLEGGVKKQNNVITSDLLLQYNPQRPKVGIEVIFTNNSNYYDSHHQVDVIFTTVTHSITVSTAGGYKKKVDEKVCDLMASVNLRALADPGEGKTFGFEMNYSNNTNENRIRHTLDSKAYAPDHEVKMDTMFKLVPVTNDLTTSFDFKWVKDQQGLTVSVSLVNTSDATNRRVAITTDIQLPQQHLVMTTNHVRRENYYERTLVATLNGEEKANTAFTYSRTLTGPQSICRPNLNILMNGKRVIFDGAVTRVNDVITHLEGSITHDQDTEASLSMLMDIAPLDMSAPADGFDITFNLVNKYIPGYDPSFTWTRIYRNNYIATPVGHNTITLSIAGTQKLEMIFSVAAEIPANVPMGASMANVLPVLVIDLDLSLPACQDEVFRNMAVNARYQCAVCDKQLLLKWGNKGDDETITIAQTLMMTSETAGDVDVSITHPFVLPMLYPTFSLGVDFDMQETMSDVKFEITTADSKKRAIQVVYTNTSLTPPLKQKAEIILTRTGKDDIKITGELKALAPDAIADMTITCEYSTIQNEHLIFNTKLVNRSDGALERQAKELEIHVDHPISNIEIDMFISSNNDTRDISIGLEGTIRCGSEHGAVTLEASWDKRDKQYTIHHVRESLESARMLERETHELTMTGTFEDKSYGDYKIYEVDMMNEYDGQRTPSFFKFDTRDKEIEYDINFNPDDRSDFYRFKAGYLNSSAVTAKIDTRRGLSHTVNASVLLYLQAPKVLYTQINWHPQWPKDLKEAAIAKWERTVKRFQARENIRFYRNKTAETFLAQWEVFKARNAEVPGTVLQLVGALGAKIEPAAIKWAMRKENIKTKLNTFATDMKTSILPYIVQANATWQARKAMMPLITLKVQTEAGNYFKAAATALEGYKNECLLPIYGSMMMNVGQIGTNMKTDIGNIKAQTLAKVVEFRTKLNETLQAVRLDMVVNGVKIYTWAKQVNGTVYGAVMERYEAMKMKVMRNPILVDVIRWGILTQDLIPLQQWNETVRALYTEISTSNDLQAIKEFWTEIMRLVEQRRTAMAEYRQLYPRNASWIKEYMLQALIKFSESQQNYKLVKADIENGEIIVLLYLQEELKNLQELPPSWKQSSSDELKNQLVSMAPLLQKQLRTQIMDPQLQEIGVFEAAYLLNMLSNNQSMSDQLMKKLQYDMYASKFFMLMHVMNMLRNPRNWIPPYDANAMLVHNQHYMTFDRRYYEFAGRCTYLLAHDFLNGNFTIYVDYSASQGDKTMKTLIVQQDDKVYTIYPDLKITDGDRIKDLPFQVGNITITRDHNSVKVHNSKGVTVTCTTPYEICHVSMSGWYYAQTAGLFGTYDYQAKNDFTLPNNEVTDTIDRFTRNWEVSTACSTTTNRADKCTDNSPASEQNSLCQKTFLSMESGFRPLFDLVDPEPFYQMCVNDMCGLTTEEERKEHICEVIKAYLSQAPASPIPMPPHCIKCETSSGTVIKPYQEPVKIENPVKEADVVIVVEEKRCAEGDIADNLHDIVIRLDTELRRNEITNNRFALVGFGGEGIHDLPHPHTIDGALFNNASRYRLGVEGLEFADDGSNDTLAAIMKAADYPFRAGVSKNIILISCSECKSSETSYTTVLDTLVTRGIQLNLLLSHDFNIKTKKNKSSKEKVYGFDDLAVYTAKMVGDETLKGDQSLRKYINEPLNKCTVLAMETNGSVFDADEINRKGFQEVFVLRMVKYSQPMTCQMCRCVPNNDWVGESVCERCGAVTAKDAFLQAMGGIWLKPAKTAKKVRDMTFQELSGY
ncbi:uncharacterized protein [Amphiura filiformis]|uniref:uncharacterized protein n=1 Tax=Amphiura filiformis TaxID=82378 RepID=UPI003B211858